MQRLTHKFETAREQLPGPIITAAQGKTKVGLIAYGSIDSAVLEGLDRLAEESMYFDYMRVRALPLSKAVRKFIESHDYVYVIENNHDGQLAKITIMDYPDLGPKIRSLAYLDGLPFTARFIKESLMEREGVK
jgi:2-oxoglutarate ferredoxin oxidoreductase subunit alpha